MIRGVHTMFYTSQPEELRAFFRDKLCLPFTDVGGGWLLFDLPDAEMGCHPADAKAGAPSGQPHLSFYCDNIEKTVAELKARGVEFTSGIEERSYGRLTRFRMPGDFDVDLYEPRYTRESQKKK